MLDISDYVDEDERMNESIMQSHIEELQKQNAALLAQVGRLSEIVQSVPQIILSARLDAKEGGETTYDYSAHNAALAV